ncbi:MAG: STAS domain-containing protein [Janthinobacterium lividum]
MNSTSTLANGILYLTPSGDFTGTLDTQQLLQSVVEYLDEATTNCAAYLSAIRYVNSTGIGVLASLLTKFCSCGGELVLINPADHPRKLLALSKLNNVFTIAADQAAALQ